MIVERRHDREVETFAAARQGQQVARRVDEVGRQSVAPGQPVGAGLAVGLGAARRRIARPLRGGPGNLLRDEARRLVLRLADGQQDGVVTAGRMGIQQAVQPGEGMEGLKAAAIGQNALVPKVPSTWTRGPAPQRGTAEAGLRPVLGPVARRYKSQTNPPESIRAAEVRQALPGSARPAG